jgi:3-carboxy-cis,cis-muconate cycloisomerase
VSEPGLFDEILARGGVREAVDDRAWLRAMLSAEAALASAQAKLGLITAADAARVADACRVEHLDLAELARKGAEHANPVVPLAARLRELAGPSVHCGATSQDILDTATMLVVRDALAVILADVTGAADAAERLASEHRDTPMAGRTLLQQAAPITFGLKAARWLAALDAARQRLSAWQPVAQLGGPAGTLTGFGEHALELVELFAAELGLAAPILPWHTDRTVIGELAGALGVTAGTLGKIARDVTLLAQSEVGEVAEDAPGGSSSMPHKRNPVAAISALAAAMQAPGLVSTLLANMIQEHERAAGAWQAEWRPLRELLIACGSAAAWTRACLTGLTVHPEALSANLAALAGRSGVDLGAAGELVDRVLAGREVR